MLKRLLDIVIASSALVLLSPVYALVAYKVKKQSVTKAVVSITSCVVVRDVKGTQGNLNSTFHLKTN